ncbi:S24 family peptidase [Ahrensia marina]|uniref:DNA-binding protein n=1 Tax=Ahrensia marina TaxID=1514904 RepID=A0A0M9GP99_9HYPH|nr:helix-turn-helix transcriptional regulator [Ahrensia marina]KPB02473.1 DNA-binding protein [Ahrensia marina]
MLSHERIWRAIDRLAEAHDLTPSGLAKRAGLDSTTFNKSKRFASDGRARWPSTESLSKIMEATGSSLREFTSMIDGAASGTDYTQPALNAAAGLAEPSHLYDMSLRGVPVVGMAQAGGGGFFDDAGFPVGQGWDQVQLPGVDADNNTYALKITGDSMLPLYREGDIIIVSPTASVRKGDRIVARTTEGEVMAKILKRKTATSIDLSSTNNEYDDLSFAITDIEWMARILWASQ